MATTVAVPARTSTTAASDGLAVAVPGNELLRLLVPATNTEGEDVHAAMAGCASAEGL